MIEHPTAPGAAPEQETEQETATIPLSIVDGQPLKEGDMVKLKVLSVDTEGGTFKAAYDHPPKPGGIDKMASQFEGETPPE